MDITLLFAPVKFLVEQLGIVMILYYLCPLQNKLHVMVALVIFWFIINGFSRWNIVMTLNIKKSSIAN